MGSTVIVALPREDEKVYRISSEKVPHMTLVYLGDNVPADQQQMIVEFTAHAAGELSPFWASVDYRGTLGPDEADVLFFENTDRDLNRVKEFRHYLLQNEAINRAYNAVDQYPEWTPHLTLGYPTSPAHKDTDEHPGIRMVDFDRIAVWTGDFEGPEFRLKWDQHAMEVSMSDMSTAERGESAVDEIFHFGVKGMKWGVHTDDSAGGRRDPELADIPRKTVVKAKKDAAEFTKAKLFYGEGAGNRRKLINAKVNEAAKDPQYKKAFDHFVAKTDLAKRANQAKRTRRRKDAVDTVDSLATNFAKTFIIQSDQDEEVLTGEDLEHSGVKGMKWGVRHDPGHEGDKVKTKKLDKLDQKWEKSIYTTSGAVATHNAMADHFNSRIGALNDKYPNAHLDHLDRPETKAYIQEVDALQAQSYAHAVKTVHGTSPSGRKEAVFVEDDNGSRIEVRDKDVKHAAVDEEPDLVLLLKRDANGRIAEANMAELAAAHGDEAEEFLAHYGVKGMRWGVTTVDKASQPTLTREKKAIRNAKDVTVTQRKSGTYVKTKGGQRQKASDDAVKAHAGRQKAKKSTTDALTNDELRAVVERMSLEQQYAKLDAKTKRRGESFVSKLFQSPEARSTAQDLLKRVSETNNKD